MTELLDKIAPLLTEKSWLTPLSALLAGVVTSFMPCSLSSIPLVIGYVGGTGQNDSKRAFKLSLIYVAGTAVTFIALGIIAALAGRLMGTAGSWWYIILGILMVLMALQTWEIFQFIPQSNLLSKSTKKGGIGAFIAGMLAGVFSSPCATPVLVALIAIVATQNDLLWGAFLFMLYSIGHGVLSVIAGTSVGFVKKLSTSERYGKASKVISIVMGALILLMGLYMFYLAF